MRAFFGLIGILVTIGVIAMIWAYAVLPYNTIVIQKGQAAQQQAQQIAGFDELGGRVTQHVSFEPIYVGGKLRSLRVTRIQPGSSYGDYYGLAVDDVIEEIGPQTVRDIGEDGMARDLAYEAYQRQWDLVVVRSGQRFVLPRDAAQAATLLPSPAQPLAVQPAAPPAGRPARPPRPDPHQPLRHTSESPIQRQLECHS